MKRNISLILLLSFLLIIFSGCGNDKNKNVYKGDKLNMIKVNIPYSMRVNTSIAIRSATIDKEYGKADILRDLDTKKYEIRNMDDGSKLFVIYDKETNRVIDIWRLKKLLSRESFKEITDGKSNLNDIINIDPYTTIIEKSKDNGISEHKLKNNEILIINYIKKKDVWIVDKTNFLNNDPSEFTKTIIQEDLQLIS